MTALNRLTMTEALAGLERRDFSALELTEAHIAAVEKARPLNAFIPETPELARDQAVAADARRARGEARPLDPVANDRPPQPRPGEASQPGSANEKGGS